MSALAYVDQALPGLDIDEHVHATVNLPVLDELLELLLGPVASNLGEAGDVADLAIDAILEGLAPVPVLGQLVETLRFEWRAVYVAPNGSRVLNTYDAAIGVPEPLDVDEDGYADVLANLTIVPVLGASEGQMPFIPTLKIAKLANVPAALPLSLQAIISGGGLISVAGSDGSLRFGYDTRGVERACRLRGDIDHRRGWLRNRY